MKRLLFHLLFLECAFLLEGRVNHLPLIAVRVDLVWLWTISLGFFVPLFPGALFVLLAGLAQESLGAPFHGPVVLSWLVLYFFLRMTHDKLLLEGGMSQVIWVVLLSLAQKGIEWGLLLGQGYVPPFDPVRLLASSILMGLLSLPLFPFLKNRGKIPPPYGN